MILESTVSNSLVYKRKKIYDYALAVLALLMPLVVKGFPVLIIISAVIGIVYFFRAYQRLGKPKKDYYLLPYNLLKDGFTNIFTERNAMFYMVLLFLIYTISIFFSSSEAPVAQKIVLKSCYIYFPLIFALTKWDKEKLLRVIDFFIYGCVLQVLISLVDAYVASGFTFIAEEFRYLRLSYNLHPSYASILIVIGFVFNSIRTLFLYKVNGSLRTNYWRVLVSFLFSVYLIMLSSKAGIASFALAITVLFGYSCFVLRSFFIPLIGLIVFLVVVSSGFFFLGGRAMGKIGAMKASISEKDTSKKRDKTQKLRSSEIRLVLWENSWEAIATSNFMGYGLGDGKIELQKTLKKNEEEFVYSLGHNSHNQYLEAGLSLGIIGMVLLFLILISSSFRYGQFTPIALLLVLIIAFNLLVESMMEKQTGSIPIVWLLCFLVSGRNIFKTVFKVN